MTAPIQTHTSDSTYSNLDATDINPLIRSRQSRRAFDPAKTVSETNLNAVLEAARWAPSGGNGQPWHFVVGRKGDPEGASTYEKLLALVMPFNLMWATNAPVLILTVASVEYTRPDGSKVQNRTALHDLGMANLALALEAEHRGMNVRMIGGFNADGARELIGAAEHGYDVGPMLVLGFPGDPAQHLPEAMQEREAAPRERKPISDIVLKI